MLYNISINYNLRYLGTAAGWYDMNPMAALPRAGNGNVVDGRYHYLKDLLELEAAATGQGPNTFRPATPLKLSEWKEALAGHPDQQFSRYILHGLAHGFHIGASRAMGLHPSHSNMPSVHQLPDLVEKQIRAEVDAGRLLGPLPPHLARMVQTSSIGLIPKPHQQGKWRLIVNLSSPAGASVNDAIASDSCHMQYTSVLEAARLIQQLGVGTQLAKLDLQNAYRMVPVHPDDHPLLGIRWGQEVYIDTALPFGLRSAPKIFSAVSDALAWILQSKGVRYQLHYLDDFLLLGPPDTAECTIAMQRTLTACKELGVPIAAHKTEGPSCQLTFLGIQIDTIRMELSLPPDKLARITAMVLEWRGKRVATKRQLQSLVGSLSHAASVVIPGRTFMRRLIDTMSVPKCQHHHVRLNRQFQSDIQWWSCFLPQWNGRTILPPQQAAHSFWSDASGTWGCGALNDDLPWFKVQWPESWHQIHIAAKEMVPVVLAVAVWGPGWRSSTVQAFSDNMAVVCALSSGLARDPLLMHLLRCLHFFTAHFRIAIRARHIAGVRNTAADALSRDKSDVFFSCLPQAPPMPVRVPQALLDMLVHDQPDWTSSSWRSLFLSTLKDL